MINKLISFLGNTLSHNKAAIIPVYSIIAFMIYSWTLITFFYTLPSWIKFLTLKEITIIFAYAMIIDLFESIIVLVGLLFLYSLLPKSWLKDGFALHGTWFAISYLGNIMVYFIPTFKINQWIPNPRLWFIIIFFVAILTTLFFSRLSILKKSTFFLLERMPTFLAIFIPVSVISLFIITIKLFF